MSTVKISHNKRSLIQALSSYMGWSRAQSAEFIDSLLAWICREMLTGTRVVLSGFGSFVLNKRKKRTVLHPITKASITIPERLIPQFTASKLFKEERL